MKLTDQMGYEVIIPHNPKIVSLVPSITELLFDLQLESTILGVTKFCIHPSSKVSDLPKIGGTKNFHFDKIDSLKPDLIIGNREENYKDGILELKKHYPVWMSDINTLDEALEMICQIGLFTDREVLANELISQIKSEEALLAKRAPKRVLYLIWRKPYMLAGKNTFIDHMLEKIGFINAVEGVDRYPALTLEEMIALSPEHIFLSSEPFPFQKKHIEEFESIVPRANIHLVDGEMFSWYGSRLTQAFPYFQSLVF
ncbi:ABC transporter substrate-binding protein [Fulvivirga ligni]|uniref:ABC transporter substrate-binding protein n=1 Tax=Fulvivirga ligni TaxID=2904246 RepID=UPI001F3228E0|nr:helical backbone metal receptor [Fulvivirga ligni]UII23004.1 helical backbone metal receptor [Fulvivirga ligni]